MNWNPRWNRDAADGIEDLAYPPAGGRGKQLCLGVFLPLVIVAVSVCCWVSQKAYWPARNEIMAVSGDAARSLAVCYAAVGLFCHFRWFWGLVPAYRVFSWGVGLSILLGLGGCASACYHLFQ